MEHCPTRARLVAEVQTTLAKLVELVALEREAVKGNSVNTAAAVDKLIDQCFGEKERAVCALTQHSKEHGC